MPRVRPYPTGNLGFEMASDPAPLTSQDYSPANALLRAGLMVGAEQRRGAAYSELRRRQKIQDDYTSALTETLQYKMANPEDKATYDYTTPGGTTVRGLTGAQRISAEGTFRTNPAAQLYDYATPKGEIVKLTGYQLATLRRSDAAKDRTGPVKRYAAAQAALRNLTAQENAEVSVFDDDAKNKVGLLEAQMKEADTPQDREALAARIYTIQRRALTMKMRTRQTYASRRAKIEAVALDEGGVGFDEALGPGDAMSPEEMDWLESFQNDFQNLKP